MSYFVFDITYEAILRESVRDLEGLVTRLRRGWEPRNESEISGFLGNLGVFWELTWDFYKTDYNWQPCEVINYTIISI